MDLSRREFGAIVGAGILFPRELLGAEKRCPEGFGNDAYDLDRMADPKAYPLYYMVNTEPFHQGYAYFHYSPNDKIYKLWQPGIIIGVAMPGLLGDAVTIYSPGKSDTPTNDLYNAILTAPANSLLVNSCYGRPYKASGDFWCHNEYGPRPVVMLDNFAETLAANGHLRRCKPFCTLDDWLKLRTLGE